MSKPLGDFSKILELQEIKQRYEECNERHQGELDSKDAIAIARDAKPAELSGSAALPEGLAIGDSVVVMPEEPGSGAVPGELAASGLHEFAIRRQSERAGELVLHFPREDYLIVKTG